MRMPALRRLWEDARESPPECGQEIILFSKGLTRRNLFIESGSVFLKGKGSPPKVDSDSPKKHPAGLGRRHQLTYEDACIAAVAGGRWRESARVWTGNNSFFKRAYATESIYREWECFSKGEGSPPKGDSDSPIEDKFEREADLASSEAERAKSDEGLGDHSRNGLWDYSPKTHRELRRAGELEERLDRKGARARAYTEDLIARGEFPPQARHWAIRVELLDSERDWA